MEREGRRGREVWGRRRGREGWGRRGTEGWGRRGGGEEMVKKERDGRVGKKGEGGG